jgi:Amt family ammonium transporter
VCVGFFSTTGTNSLGNNGVFYGGGGKYGGWNLVLHQAMAAGAVSVYSFGATFVIAKAIGLVMKTRVTPEDEVAGLDTAIHGESAYDFGGVAASGQYAPAAWTPETAEAEGVHA